MPDASTVLVGVLLLFGIAAIWTIVELAYTMRKTRKMVKELSTEVSETIDRVAPLIDKTEAVVDELDPAVKQLGPLLDHMGVAVDALTYDLLQVEEVLTHVARVTSAGAQATDAISLGVSKATSALSNGLVGILDRISHKPSDEKKALPRDEQRRLSSLSHESEAGLKRPFAQGHVRPSYTSAGVTNDIPLDSPLTSKVQTTRTAHEYYEYPSKQDAAATATQAYENEPAEEYAQTTDSAPAPENFPAYEDTSASSVFTDDSNNASN